MAFVLNDRVKETTTTTGTGTVNLGGAATGFETFVAGVGNSNSTYYCIAGQTTAEFEVGIGTVTDALFNKVKVFCLFEENNLEMISNAKKLELAGLTKNFYKNKSIIDEIIKYINNQNEVENYKNKIKKIDFSGAYQTAKLIAGL